MLLSVLLRFGCLLEVPQLEAPDLSGSFAPGKLGIVAVGKHTDFATAVIQVGFAQTVAASM